MSYIVSAVVDAVTDTYRRIYPRFQASHERPGYPDAYFNDRVITVGRACLGLPRVLYESAEPDLEAMSAGQKKLRIALNTQQRSETA